MNFTLLILLFDRTGSTIATSFLWISYALPAIFIGPFAAASIDVTDKRKVLIITNFLQSLLIFLYALVQHTSVFLLYGIAILYSLLNQFYVPAELSSLPTLIKKEFLSQANGLFFITQQAALIIGFGIASPFYTYLGFKNTLLICSMLLLLASVSTVFLPRMIVIERQTKLLEKNLLAFVKKILEGYELIRENRNVLAPFLLLMSLQIALAIAVVNAPVIATAIFGIPINLIGLFLIVPAGVGSAIGAFIIPRLLRKNVRKIKLIQNFLFVLSLVLFTLIFILPNFPQPQRLVIGMITLILSGISFVGVFIPSQTFLQEKTPGGFRGRVFGNYWFLVTIATVFPVIFSGTITELFGIKILLFILAIGLASLFVFIRNRGEAFLSSI